MAVHVGRHFLGMCKLDLELVHQTFAKGADRTLDAAVTDPGSFLLGLDHACILQNLHVVRDRRLGEFDSLLDVGSGPAFRAASLARRGGMKQAEDFSPGRIGNGSERQAQLVWCSLHSRSPIIMHPTGRARNKQYCDVTVVTSGV